MALGILDPSVTAPASYLDHVAYFIGGTAAAPTTPRPASVLKTGIGQHFMVDMLGRSVYYLDGNGNLMQQSLTSLSSPPVQLRTQAQIGDTLTWLEIALDNSALYAIGAADKIYKVLTAAPYTVTVVAGSGAQGSADGTGAAATFNSLHTLFLDQASGQLLYTFDGQSGSIRSINVATGLVQTIVNGIGQPPGNLVKSKDGNFYGMSNERMRHYSASSGGSDDIALVAGHYTNPATIDDGEPGSFFLYFMAGAGAGDFLNVYRYEVATGAVTIIATLTTSASTTNYNDGARLIYRTPALYLVDTANNLVQIQG